MTATALRLLPSADQRVAARASVLVCVRVRNVAHNVRSRARARAILRGMRSAELFAEALAALPDYVHVGRVEAGCAITFVDVPALLARQLRARAVAAGVRTGDVMTAAMAAWMEKR